MSWADFTAPDSVGSALDGERTAGDVYRDRRLRTASDRDVSRKREQRFYLRDRTTNFDGVEKVPRTRDHYSGENSDYSCRDRQLEDAEPTPYGRLHLRILRSEPPKDVIGALRLLPVGVARGAAVAGDLTRPSCDSERMNITIEYCTY